MADIQTEADIAYFLDRFYARVRQDPDLGPIFNDVARVDWVTHLPKIAQFWASILLGTNSYQGQPMRPHFELAQQTSIRPEHFKPVAFFVHPDATGLFRGRTCQ